MSTSSTTSRKPARRVDSSTQERLSRTTSRVRPQQVSYHEAYTFALRAAFLHHLLQPRAKRKQYIQPPKLTRTVTTSSISDLVKDISGLNPKSGKFPHGFMSPLERRMQGVVVGMERLPGFNDASVKRTFAEAYTAFTETGFRRRMDKERRVEDLVLIFYSNATKALQKGRAPDDDAWKGMVDRHVALFVRLLSNTLKDNGSDRDRPELMTRLATLEKKLLTEDQDLSVGAGPNDAFVEVTAPVSYDVKDMKMVQIVAEIFGLKHSQVKMDIEASKTIWTEQAALSDLKMYQHCLTSGSSRTLRSENFDTDEAYQTWKKAEIPDLSQMILDILHVKPELAKSTSDTGKALPPINTAMANKRPLEFPKLSSPATVQSPYGFDQPVDITQLSSKDDCMSPVFLEQATYTFIPSDPRAYYRSILVHAMGFDSLRNTQQIPEGPPVTAPLSKSAIELLTELSIRWRIPQYTRLVLFLDVASQRFMDQEIGVEDLDTAFEFAKSPPPEVKRAGTHTHSSGLRTSDQTTWTVKDYALYRQTLTNLHDALLREVYDIMQHCYETKPPSIALAMGVLETHIYSDPAFFKSEAQVKSFAVEMEKGLAEKAANVYRTYLEAEVPNSQEDWQFFHIVQLGKSVVKLCQRIQKRYSRNPEVMGVNPLKILVGTMFPSFENDAGDLIQRILNVAEAQNTKVDLQDGFDLYKELVEIRRIHRDALPNVPFAFHIEGLLEDFVWRWIRNAGDRMIELVNTAIAQDQFQVRSEQPSDAEKHSVSIIDVFRLFNETTDQVFQLEWDDDVHHAQYMTALSKSFGLGLARYCEVLELDFTTEMSRISPAQELANTQSKQEKWMQLAKDAWNNKEKIEPFQFYPKSLVKLNNIEFAIQQLDKLEKIMNVDACSAVLDKLVSKDQKRKPSKFVFTIKIVEAEGLKACDTNGFSDPYVVLVDEFQKRLTKTRVIQKNLNPRWDETIDITVQGSVNIVAMIWDSDTFGEDDYVGRTSLKLDPAHFSDYLPKECWLDLDTQGRLLLRVSMEGERDDIQFYFGKAFRLLKRTERDMTRKITDKLSTYINVCLSQNALRSLMSRGISISSVTNMWKNRQSMVPPSLTALDVENALKPLFTYFDENFAIMQETLTSGSMIMVMTRLWKEVLLAVEAILIPPLSDKPSNQRALTQQELDVVFKWLELLFNFFHAPDEKTGEALGVPSDVLQSPKWHELKSLNFFYTESTDSLIRTSERMASATAQRSQQQRNRVSAPANLGATVGSAGVAGVTSKRRAKSIMLSRNLGTMKKAKEEKRKEAQADPSDDIILRILRMRPEPVAAIYLRDRSRQKERLAAHAAAEMIVRQSLAASNSRFGTSNLPIR